MNDEHERRCYACAREIAECMGSCLGRTLGVIDNGWPPELPIIEFCGYCMLAEPMPLLTLDY